MSSASGVAASPEVTSAPRELARALSLRDSIALENDTPKKVLFVPFVGIAPPRFRDFFLMADRKQDNGRIMVWDEVKRSSQPRIRSDPQSYIRREAYGDLPAFLFGWTSVMLIASGGLAAVSTALASFMASFVPLGSVWITHDFHVLGQVVHWRLGVQQVVAVAVILLFCAINARGVAVGGKVQWVATVAKIGGIAIITVGALLLSRTGTWANLAKPATDQIAPSGAGAFGAAMVAALWA